MLYSDHAGADGKEVKASSYCYGFVKDGNVARKYLLPGDATDYYSSNLHESLDGEAYIDIDKTGCFSQFGTSRPEAETLGCL